MNNRQAEPTIDSRAELQWSLLRWIGGFVTGALAVLLLPRAVRLFIRRILPGLLLDVILAVTVGLITEKAIEWLQRHPETSPTTPEPHGAASSTERTS